MVTRSIKFIILLSVCTSIPLTQEAKTGNWFREKKKTYWDSLSTPKKMALGAAAGLTFTGLAYYALQRNDWALYNKLSHYISPAETQSTIQKGYNSLIKSISVTPFNPEKDFKLVTYFLGLLRTDEKEYNRLKRLFFRAAKFVPQPGKKEFYKKLFEYVEYLAKNNP